ncbi:MAG: hypothetical protein ACI94Y_000032 [Maribacter sp.]|jgi:hypothetical protein
MKTFFSLFSYKRIFITNIIIPILLGFLMMTIIGRSISRKMNHFDSTFSLGLVNLDEGNELATEIKKRKDIQLVEGITQQNISKKLKENEIDLALVIPEDFSKSIAQGGKIALQLYHENNLTQIDDLMSSISDFEENIIKTRLDSIGRNNAFINPIEIDNVYDSNFTETTNKTISNYGPLLLFIFGFAGLILPSIIIFSEAKEKRNIKSLTLLDKLLGISIWGVFSGMLFLLGLWLSIWFMSGLPAFIKGFFKQYFTIINTLHFTWVFLLAHFFWVSLLSFFNAKAERHIGALGISYFIFSLFLFGLAFSSAFLPLFEEGNSIIFAFIPIINALAVIKKILLGTGIDFIFILLSILSFLLWGGLGYFILKKQTA